MPSVHVPKPKPMKGETMENAINGSKPSRQRGNGPVSFEYLNANGSRERRPSEPSKVFVKDAKSGEVHTLDLGKLDPPVLLTLAALGYQRFIETYVRNHSEDDGATVLGLIQDRSGEIEEGKFYIRTAVGGGKGRQVDVTPWVDAFELAFKKVNKKAPAGMVEAKAAQFRAKLESMTGADRNVLIANFKKNNPHFKTALLEVTAKMAAEKTKGIKEEFDFDSFVA